jgi:glycosyltransferase involved in cell wall biosynthesis
LLRVVTDIDGLERVAPQGVTVLTFSAARYENRWKRNFLLLRSALRADHLVAHFQLVDVMFFSLFLTLIPFQRCRLTTLDFFIGRPNPRFLPVIRFLLGRVTRFLVYFRDSSWFERLLRVPSSKFYYVPFKINAWELIENTPSTDEGYIFSGGRSRRDFATFFAAVRDLGYPVRLITGREADLAPHGSSLVGLAVPPNVEILNNDSDAGFFVESLAGARLVVLPLVPDSTTQAGIGVYLQAMAAGKCVIISDGLGVGDVLTGEEACIVPPGNVEALRSAIERLWNDDALRERYAQAGRRYAAPLGGEDELRRSVLQALPPISASSGAEQRLVGESKPQ